MIKLSKGSKNYYLTCENGQLVFIKNIKVRNKNDVKDGNKTAKKQVYKIRVGFDLLPNEADSLILKNMLEKWGVKMLKKKNLSKNTAFFILFLMFCFYNYAGDFFNLISKYQVGGEAIQSPLGYAMAYLFIILTFLVLLCFYVAIVSLYLNKKYVLSGKGMPLDMIVTILEKKSNRV